MAKIVFNDNLFPQFMKENSPASSNVSVSYNLQIVTVTVISQSASEDEADFDYEQRWARGGPQGANQEVSLKHFIGTQHDHIQQLA